MQPLCRVFLLDLDSPYPLYRRDVFMYQGRHFKVVTPPPGYQASSTRTQSFFQQMIGSYFSLSVWKRVSQYSIQHQYWMRGAAIAYGTAGCLLLSFFALLAGASLSPPVETALLAALARWDLINTESIGNLITQTTAGWEASHRWALLVASTILVSSLWLKLVGTAQRILSRIGAREALSPISIRQRLTTALLALVSALLLLLAYSFVFASLPSGISEAIAETNVWNVGKRLIIQGLRWSLAFSTVSLMVGLFYRASLNFSVREQPPLLPGTVMATALWTVVSVLLKMHLNAISNHHWLYGVCSTLALLMLGIYLNAIGLLIGGCFNTLLSYYLPQARSQPHYWGTPSPPPSFESFTIQRRKDQ